MEPTTAPTETCWLISVIAHPNTASYFQTIALALIAWLGANEIGKHIGKKKAEFKFDLAIACYSIAAKAGGSLLGFKDGKRAMLSREFINEIKKTGEINFINFAIRYAKDSRERINNYSSLFDELREKCTTARFLFDKSDSNKTYSAPISDIISCYDRVVQLLDTIQSFETVCKDDNAQLILNPAGINEIAEIIDSSLVQIWENIDLNETQKKRLEEENVKNPGGEFKFHSMDQKITHALVAIDQLYPNLV